MAIVCDIVRDMSRLPQHLWPGAHNTVQSSPGKHFSMFHSAIFGNTILHFIPYFASGTRTFPSTKSLCHQSSSILLISLVRHLLLQQYVRRVLITHTPRNAHGAQDPDNGSLRGIVLHSCIEPHRDPQSIPSEVYRNAPRQDRLGHNGAGVQANSRSIRDLDVEA